MNKRIWGRHGNRSTVICPHNIYRCKSNEAWVVIAIESEDEWQAFCKVIDKPEWAREDRFCTLENRMANQDKLDALIGAWTIQHDPYQVMGTLQEAGVPSGAVTVPDMLVEEPHLNERGFWVE